MTEYRELSKVFSPSFIRELASGKRIEEIINVSCITKRLERLVMSHDYRQFYNEAYRKLLKNYRFEYIYKNEIYMYIMKTYNISNDDGILSEVKSGKSIADIVFLNGTSKVYEIKTEIDNNNRLIDQISDYSKLFKETVVVTHESNAKKLVETLPSHIGIMSFVRQGEFITLRESTQFTENLDRSQMFETLWRKEYEQIVFEKFGELPQVNDAEIYDACFEKFNEIDALEAHDLTMKQLKKRSNKALLHNSRKYPKNAKFLIETSSIKKSEKDILSDLLS